jgi:hypothetical protein
MMCCIFRLLARRLQTSKKVMPNCIFCGAPLDANTKPEHILINALGGRNTTRTVDCSDCNERFGGTIDKALADSVAGLRNMLVLESGSGKPPPTLRRVKAGSDVINLNSDGTLEAVQKPFTVTHNPDGTINLEIRANSYEEIARHIPNIAGALKCTEEQVMQLLKKTEGTWVSRRPGTVHFHFGFGGPEVSQALVKACLVLWATAVGNEEVASESFTEARRFVLEGGETFSRTRVHLDSRHPFPLDEWKQRFGPFFNLIYIRSDAAGRVVGHFTLYNVIGWHMVLAENGGTPNLKIALAANPMAPAAVTPLQLAEEIDIPFDWLDAPEYPRDLKRAQERLAAFVERAQKDALGRQTQAIVRAVFEKHGILEGTAVTDPVVKQAILGEITHRFGLHVMNLPFEEKVSGATILDALKSKADRKSD